MLAKRRNVETSKRQDVDTYIPLAEAARLTGLSVRHWRRRAVFLAARGQAHQAPPPGGSGKPTWWIARAVDPRLATNADPPTRDQRARALLLERYPAAHVERAYRKAHWLKKWRAGMWGSGWGSATRAANGIIAKARRIEDPSFRISVRSLQAWHKAYSELGPDGQIRGLEALVPRYGPPLPRGDSAGSVSRAPEAIDYFYELYRTQNCLSIRTCHGATRRASLRAGWPWPAGYTATVKWLDHYDDRSLAFLSREGPEAWSRRYLPHLEMDWDAVEPGEFYVADHTPCDFWVLYRGKLIRPWLTGIQDCRTRCIVGWHLGPSPHQDAIIASLRMAFRGWSIPRTLRIDNGCDFTSKLITGVTKSEARALRRAHGHTWKNLIRRDRELVTCDDERWLGITGELGIELIYAVPYAAWSKGTIERWFGTFEDQCGRTFATYCGNTPSRRPECLPNILAAKNQSRDHQSRDHQSRDRKGATIRAATIRAATIRAATVRERSGQSDVPTLEQARVRIAEYLELYHNQPHRGLAGATPLAVWGTAASVRRAEDNALLLLMNTRGALKVGANGVSLTIGGARLTYGAGSPALRPYVGRKVLVAIDSAHVGECWALDCKTRRLIARLEPNERVHPNATTEDVREAIGKIKRAQSVMSKAARAAARRTRTATQRLNRDVAGRLAALRATGTDDQAVPPAIAPVCTGFENASRPVPTGFEPLANRAAPSDQSRDRKGAVRSQRPPDPYDALDLTAVDLSTGHAPAATFNPYRDVDLTNLDLAEPDEDDEDDVLDMGKINLSETGR